MIAHPENPVVPHLRFRKDTPICRTPFISKALQPAIDDGDAVAIRGDWKTVASAPGGFCESNLLRARPGQEASVTFETRVPKSGKYEVSARWINDISDPIHYATNTRIDVIHAGGIKTFRVNQRRSGGKWNSLGVLPFDEESPVRIIIRTEGANGHVQADAVRLDPV